MTAATDLWDRVTSDYDANGLIALTNIRDRSQTTINDVVGQAASQAVIDLWPIYAQVDYDETSTAHIAVAEMGVIAMLWRRGGSADEIQRVKWEEVFGSDGLISKVRMTGPRSHSVPVSSSGVQQASELSNGRYVRSWSEPDSLPPGFLPARKPAT